MARRKNDDHARFRWEDSDETEGRRLYRVRANAEVRREATMARIITLKGAGDA